MVPSGARLTPLMVTHRLVTPMLDVSFCFATDLPPCISCEHSRVAVLGTDHRKVKLSCVHVVIARTLGKALDVIDHEWRRAEEDVDVVDRIGVHLEASPTTNVREVAHWGVPVA